MLSRPALVVLAAAAALAAAGCGGDGGNGGDAAETTGTAPATSGPAPTTPAPGQGASSERETRPSRQERSLQRDLDRHLREEALTRSRGEWTLADIRSVQVEGRQVVVSTRLRGRRGREQASSLCLAARQYFLAQGQAQTPYDVAVTGTGGTRAAC
jgi:hypothetical protein